MSNKTVTAVTGNCFCSSGPSSTSSASLCQHSRYFPGSHVTAMIQGKTVYRKLHNRKSQILVSFWIALHSNNNVSQLHSRQCVVLITSALCWVNTRCYWSCCCLTPWIITRFTVMRSPGTSEPDWNIWPNVEQCHHHVQLISNFPKVPRTFYIRLYSVL